MKSYTVFILGESLRRYNSKGKYAVSVESEKGVLYSSSDICTYYLVSLPNFSSATFRTKQAHHLVPSCMRVVLVV